MKTACGRRLGQTLPMLPAQCAKTCQCCAKLSCAVLCWGVLLHLACGPDVCHLPVPFLATLGSTHLAHGEHAHMRSKGLGILPAQQQQRACVLLINKQACVGADISMP